MLRAENYVKYEQALESVIEILLDQARSMKNISREKERNENPTCKIG